MALVESVKIDLGSIMPAFELNDPAGKIFKSADLYGPKGLLIAFTCNHCPYAMAIWPRLIRLAKQARELGIETAGINPNIHPDYPEDSPAQMAEKIKQWKIPFPYLIDETQKTAQAFRAQCTPDLYLYNAAQALVYHGRFDDNWQDERKVKDEDLKKAVEHLAAGKAIDQNQRSSMGCSIKWR